MNAINFNVLCVGGTHPITGRPCHPARARSWHAFEDWVYDRIVNFIRDAEVLFRIPGGWIPSDGPKHLFTQLRMGHSPLSYAEEMANWYRLCEDLLEDGYTPNIYLGDPRQVSPQEQIQLLRQFPPGTHFTFDATADIEEGYEPPAFDDECEAMTDYPCCSEGWPRRSSIFNFDPNLALCIQSNNLQRLISRLDTPSWDPSLTPLDELDHLNSPMGRFLIFIEQDDEDSVAVRNWALEMAKLGSRIYINPSNGTRKWGSTIWELEQVAKLNPEITDVKQINQRYLNDTRHPLVVSPESTLGTDPWSAF